MAASITITPVVSGREDEWREFVAELKGSRRIEWAQSQRRRGITRQVISLAGHDPALAVVYTEAGDPERASSALLDSDDPFDLWFRTRTDELHAEPLSSEVMFDSAPKPGPWRGWR